MDWYAKLSDYFPAEEMKSRAHMELLFNEKNGIYKKEEADNYLLIYFEKEDFLFIDFVLISSAVRGQGLGSKVIQTLQSKQKPIILEVDPITPADPFTLKRARFYQKNGFTDVPSIEYVRRHVLTNDLNIMTVYYWSPIRLTDDWIFTKMSQIYQEVHAYKAKELYGVACQPVEEVLAMPKGLTP